ncbi:MAG: glycine cleavage system protein H [Planctomycetes bacterium]|nr:glycine cleavage system protein H [Planctomycetota bacterium]
MAEVRYTPSHEWCALEGDVLTCGISRHAAEELSDLTFLEFRVEAGATVAAKEPVVEIDAVKTTAEVYAPFAGTVTEVNERFTNEDELPKLSADAEGEGWLFKLKLDDTSGFAGLLDAEAYRAHCAEG